MAQSDPLFDVAGEVILVAGAAGGLGSAIATALAERHARVIITDIDQQGAERVAAGCSAGCETETGVLDIRDEAAISRKLDAIVKKYGCLDGLVNAAGAYHIGSIAELTERDVRDSIDTNFTGPFILTRAAARIMGKGGSILHLASVSSLVANPAYTAYSSSKAALSQMVRIAARELAADGITVNAIGPAVTETPMIADHLADPAFRANAIAHIPMGRLGLPDDIIAQAVLLLAPGGAFITGQTIYVDGGRTLV